MQPEELFASVFVLVVVSGVFIVVMGLRQRTQLLEMQHRERMAMIERGLAPFDERRSPPGMGAVSAAGYRRGPASRATPLGIVVIAVGLGLMSIVSIAGESPEVGVGLGGAIVVVGAAFVAIGMLSRMQSSEGPPPPPPLPPASRDPSL